MGHISCKAPWLGLSVRSDNTLGVCSSSSFSVPLEDFSTLSQAMNSEGLRTYRADHFNNSPLSSCHVCTKRSEINVRCLRNMFDELPKQVKASEKMDFVDPSEIVSLDLNVSTHCNLKCRMCSAVRSSGWHSDQNYLASRLGFVSPPPEKQTVSLTLDFEKFRNLRFLILKGGEPLFDKASIDLMHRLVELGQSKNIALTIYTNGMFAKKHAELFSKFRQLSLIFSFEATGDLYSYIRGGAHSFSEFTENIKAFSGAENIWASFMYTPQAYNIFDLPEALDYITETANPLLHHKLQLRNVQTAFSNILVDPSYLAIDILPDTVRRAALKKLRERKSAMAVNWDGIEQLLLKPQNKEGYQQFLQFTKLLDQRRGENLFNAVPEFANSEIQDDFQNVSLPEES